MTTDPASASTIASSVHPPSVHPSSTQTRPGADERGAVSFHVVIAAKHKSELESGPEAQFGGVLKKRMSHADDDIFSFSFFLVVQQYGLYEFSFLNDFIVRGQWPQELHNQ